MGFTCLTQVMEEEMQSWQKIIVVTAVLGVMAPLGNVWAGAFADAAASLELQITALQATVADQQEMIDGLTAQLAAVEDNPVLDYISLDMEEINGVAGPHVIFDGVNVHLRSGSGETDDGSSNGPFTGLGNLIIGYNEIPDREPALSGNRNGSHNLVMGIENSFSSYAGLVHGENNAVRDEHSAAIGGHANDVPGSYAVAIGGHYNTISGTEAVSIGGADNTVSGKLATVTGGSYNTASGRESSVSGGSYNTASGDKSSVSGGTEVEAVNDYSWAAGTLSE